MKVLHESPNELRLKSKSDLGTGLFLLLFVGLFLGTPLISLYSIVPDFRTVTISCRRAQPDIVNCTRQDTTVMGLGSSTMEFNQVSAVILQHIAADKSYKPIVRHSRKPQHVVLLETDRGKVGLVENTSFGGYSKSDGVQEVTHRLYQFLASERPEFQYEINNSLPLNPLPIFGLCGFMALIGLGVSIWHLREVSSGRTAFSQRAGPASTSAMDATRPPPSGDFFGRHYRSHDQYLSQHH